MGFLVMSHYSENLTHLLYFQDCGRYQDILITLVKFFFGLEFS